MSTTAAQPYITGKAITPVSWTVPSESHDEVVYVVTRTPTGFTCTCADFRYRSPNIPGHECKHIDSLKGYLTLDSVGMAGLFGAGLAAVDLRALAAASEVFARLSLRAGGQ